MTKISIIGFIGRHGHPANVSAPPPEAVHSNCLLALKFYVRPFPHPAINNDRPLKWVWGGSAMVI